MPRFLRRPRQETAAASGPRTTMPLPLDSAHGSQPEVDRSSLVEAIAQLDERFQLGEIGEEDFRRHRYDFEGPTYARYAHVREVS